MDSGTVVDFFAIAVLGATIGVVPLMARRSTRAWLAASALEFSALVAVGATLGSLYLSEVVGLIPCELCWFQRIAMYPMAIMLPIAAWRQDRTISTYALPLAAIGLIISIYHVQLQAFPNQSSFCEVANPCTDSPVNALGWMTIPQMTALCFALIALFAVIQRKTPDKDFT